MNGRKQEKTTNLHMYMIMMWYDLVQGINCLGEGVAYSPCQDHDKSTSVPRNQKIYEGKERYDGSLFITLLSPNILMLSQVSLLLHG